MRRVVGVVLLLAGFGGLIAAAVVRDQPVLTAVAALAAFAGLVAAGPLLARGMAGLAGHGRQGGGWRLAARNIARAPQRAAATALALTIGLTVVSAVAVTAESAKDSIEGMVGGGMRSDLILQPLGQGSGISPEVVDVLREQDDVETVVELRYSGARVQDANTFVAARPPRGSRRSPTSASPRARSPTSAPGRCCSASTRPRPSASRPATPSP